MSTGRHIFLDLLRMAYIASNNAVLNVDSLGIPFSSSK
jgi:hypothetical protein